MNSNVKAVEKIALVGVRNPATQANTESFSSVIDMSKFGQVMAMALLGDMASETITFRAVTCDAEGNNVVALKSATQLAAHASNNDNDQLIINVRAEELLASGRQHVKFGLVTGGATGGPAAIAVVATDLRQGLAADQDLASVVEIVD